MAFEETVAAAALARVPESPEMELAPLAEVPLQVTVRLGSARLTLGELLQLREGSVVLLERELDQPVELLVGDRVVALGEMVRVGQELGLRLTRVSGGLRS